MTERKTDNDIIRSLAKKINVIWYGSILLLLLLVPITGWVVNDVYTKILAIETRMSTGKDDTLAREETIRDKFSMDILRLEKQINLLERHVLIILMNQKRMMLGLKVPYNEPYNDRTIEDIIQEFNKER